MRIYKPKFWNKKNYSFVAILLLPISFIIQIFALIKKIITIKKKYPVPIICVGNIYLGGTGKTPLTIKIYNILNALGKKPIVIKKFYKNQIDEINMIERNKCKVISSYSRSNTINLALRDKYNAMILDDGFQDVSIKKDLNILCFNERQLIGNGLTIPSGPLREPIKSIKNSQIIIINGNQNKEFEILIKGISKKISIYYSKYEPINIQEFKKKKVIAFAGIGNSDNFFNLLEENDIEIQKKIYFPDHYNYSLKDMNEIINLAKEKNCILVTTEKDFCRLEKFKNKNINCLFIKLKITNENNFINELKRYIK